MWLLCSLKYILVRILSPEVWTKLEFWKALSLLKLGATPQPLLLDDCQLRAGGLSQRDDSFYFYEKSSITGTPAVLRAVASLCTVQQAEGPELFISRDFPGSVYHEISPWVFQHFSNCDIFLYIILFSMWLICHWLPPQNQRLGGLPVFQEDVLPGQETLVSASGSIPSLSPNSVWCGACWASCAEHQ